MLNQEEYYEIKTYLQGIARLLIPRPMDLILFQKIITGEEKEQNAPEEIISEALSFLLKGLDTGEWSAELSWYSYLYDQRGENQKDC